MKNAIIAVLSILLIFFVLQSLGAFQYGPAIDRNYRDHFVRERVDAVTDAPEWVAAVTHIKDYALSEDALLGMRCAVEMINAEGGVLGKPFRLEVGATGLSLEDHRRAVQSFCAAPSTAFYFGPFQTEYVPSVRALTQYQGLPCIAPMTVSDPLWEKLEPDNYLSLYPPLRLWAEALAEDMISRGYDKILIISPSSGTYGWIYASAVESAIRLKNPHAEIFRINYESPVTESGLLRSLLIYEENRDIDAVVFAGQFDELLVYDAVTRRARRRTPVYGDDVLDFSGIAEQSARLGFPLFVPECRLAPPSPDFVAAYRERTGKDPSIWSVLGARAIFFAAEALRRNGAYHPDRLIETMRALEEEQRRASGAHIALRRYNAAEPKP